jgi:hypothetical protein
MGEFFKKIAEILVTTFRHSTFYRALSFGILFSIVMTLIIGGIEQVFKLTKDFPFFEVENQNYWVGIIFVSFALLFAILGYLSELNARDDLLTPLRKKLVGYWHVRSENWHIEKGKIEFGWEPNYCTIGIEPLAGKLIIRFEVSHNEIFKDQVINIRTTAFDFDGTDVELIYFNKTELELNNPVGTPPDLTTKLDFPFLGVVKIEEDEMGQVNSTSGRWYDINNAVYYLARRMGPIEGLPELRDAVEHGAVTFGGALEFKRIPKPPGATPAEG